MAASPSSSPRLPSPPPIAEDQIGPKSPLPSLLDETSKTDRSEDFNQGASRRIRPGTKAAEMPEGPPLMDLAEIDSPFQLTEHLKALYTSATHHGDEHLITPINRETAIRLSQPPDGVDKALWLYELCRFLCQKANTIIVALFADNPPCSAQTCNEMRASEWQYLCAVHDPPKSCCAIDYCCHTLDWAANILTSPKQFPSRLSLGNEPSANQSQLRQLTNILRRVYRIFAHAWFQHREMFWKVEGETGLYVFFKTVCDVYNLMDEENYTIPPEAEGLEAPEQDTTQLFHEDYDHKSATQHTQSEQHENSDAGTTNHIEVLPITASATTKRHRHAPSTDTASITTVIEEAEEDDKPAIKATQLPQSHLTPGQAQTHSTSHGPPNDQEMEFISSNATIGSTSRPIMLNDEDLPKSPEANTEMTVETQMPLSSLSTLPNEPSFTVDQLVDSSEEHETALNERSQNVDVDRPTEEVKAKASDREIEGTANNNTTSTPANAVDPNTSKTDEVVKDEGTEHKSTNSSASEDGVSKSNTTERSTSNDNKTREDKGAASSPPDEDTQKNVDLKDHTSEGKIPKVEVSNDKETKAGTSKDKPRAEDALVLRTATAKSDPIEPADDKVAILKDTKQESEQESVMEARSTSI